MMFFVLSVLAACAGVVLAALDSPHVRDKARLERFSTVLVIVTAVSVAAGAGHTLLNRIIE